MNEQQFLEEQEKLKYSNQLKELEQSEVWQKIMAGMLSKATSYLRVIDDPALSVEKKEEAIRCRSTIIWFIRTLAHTVADKDRIEEKIRKYLDYQEKKKTGGDVH